MQVKLRELDGVDEAMNLAALAGDARVGSRNPPGFYGTESARRALNLGPFVADAAPMAEASRCSA